MGSIMETDTVVYYQEVPALEPDEPTEDLAPEEDLPLDGVAAVAAPGLEAAEAAAPKRAAHSERRYQTLVGLLTLLLVIVVVFILSPYSPL
jgi:hypothetical protein